MFLKIEKQFKTLKVWTMQRRRNWERRRISYRKLFWAKFGRN